MDTSKIVAIGPGAIRPAAHYGTYFTVRPGACWGPRVIDDVELIYVVAGRFALEWKARGLVPDLDEAGREATGGKRLVEVVAGDVLVIMPEELHTFRHLPAGGRGVIGCIHLDLLPAGADPWRTALEPALARVTKTGGDPAIQGLFKQADEAFNGHGRYRQELLDAICRAVWVRLAEHRAGRRTGGAAARVEKMRLFLRERLDQAVGRRDLARAFSITPEHVDYLFRKELGMTPTGYLQRERIQAGLRLLQEGCSVKEAAAQVGMADPFYFSRLFKRLVGIPPSTVAAGVS